MLLYLSCVFLVANDVFAVSLDDDPSLWPGHMEPIGSKQNVVDVEVLNEWPSPKEFFADFIDKSRPALFKGLAKRSPSYRLWDDDYLLNHPGSDEQLVYVEPEKKENRTKPGKEITFKTFIEIYHNESIYMVNGVPRNVQKDVLLPPPLRCEETRKLLLDAVTWFSSGGTKSVIHHDDLDNINCLMRGTKRLWFINPHKYEQYVPLNEGNTRGYAPIDVDKVDFVKYPKLRNIAEYIRADMEEGDCLFIPYKWIHQVNSKANDKGQNIAVNIWFTHLKNHHPEKCVVPAEEATINKWRFSDLEKTQTEMEEVQKTGPYGTNAPEDSNTDNAAPEDLSLIEQYESLLSMTKKRKANFKVFLKLLEHKNKERIGDKVVGVDFGPDYKKLAKELFDVLDVTKNGVMNTKDFDVAEAASDASFEEAVNKTDAKLLEYLKMYFGESSSSKDVNQRTDL